MTCSSTWPIHVPVRSRSKKPPRSPIEQRCSIIDGSQAMIRSLKPGSVLDGKSSSCPRSTQASRTGNAAHWFGPRRTLSDVIFIVSEVISIWMACMFSSPIADACAGSVGVLFFQPPDVPGVLSGQKQHGSRCNRQGASPRRSDDVRVVVHMPTVARRSWCALSGRPAVRGRGRSASGEHEVRRQANERLGRNSPYQQPTGRSGHGLADVPSHEAGCHRRTPHGRAFACGSRSSQHHESN